MNWEELILEINQIPWDRRNEKAVFVVNDGEEAYEIDAVSITEGNSLAWDDLETHGIYHEDDEIDINKPPIALTP
jgi:hypothetical protein